LSGDPRFTEDGRFAYAAAYQDDQRAGRTWSLRVARAADARPLAVFAAPAPAGDFPFHVVSGADGHWLAVACPGTRDGAAGPPDGREGAPPRLHVWSEEAGWAVLDLAFEARPGLPEGCLKFGAAGRLVAFSNKEVLTVWDPKAG